MTRTRLLSFVSVAVLATSSLVSARQAPAAQAPAPGAAAAPAAQAGRGGGRGGGAVRSPEIAPDGRVTFRLRMPSATEVVAQVGQRRLAMQKDANGVWSVTSDPLPPDIYTYSLVVDGTSMNDPGNRQVQTSWAGFQSMFMISGPQPWLPQPGVARGAVTRHPFHSAVANDDRDFYVYTPAGYDARRSKAYPVLYLLHGLGDDAERWMNAGAANIIMDNLIAQGKAVPMVMVTTLGYGTNTGTAGGTTPENILGYEKILLTEVMPMVDKAYNVSKNREERAIAGLSMGGAETLYVGLNNLDRFAWVSAFSSAPSLFPPAAAGRAGGAGRGAAAPAAPAPAAAAPAPAAAPTAAAAPAAAPAAGRGGRGGGAPAPPMDPAIFDKTFPNLDAKSNSKIKMLWIVCGLDDGLLSSNRDFKNWLKTKNVKFTEQEVPGMAHVWPLWRQNVADMAPKLFKD